MKMLTHKHMELYTWWCWHICKGGDDLQGRVGFGTLSPSRRACEAGFGAFEKIGCTFSIAPDAKLLRKRRRRRGVEKVFFRRRRTLRQKRPDAGQTRPARCEAQQKAADARSCVRATSGGSADADQKVFVQARSSEAKRGGRCTVFRPRPALEGADASGAC